MLKAGRVTTSLTMTAAYGANEDQFGDMLAYVFGTEHIVSLMIQPMTFAGRGRTLKGRLERMTVPDVLQLLDEAGHPSVSREDFVPLPCSHPLCFSLAYYLIGDDGGAVSINSLADASTMLDCMCNRLFYGLEPGEHERMKEMIYDLWSGPSALAPDSAAVLRTLRGILKSLSEASTGEGFDPRKAFRAAERNVKSIFIHAFQDADTFDLSRVRRCCQGYPQRDGRLIPACVRNVLRLPLAAAVE